MINLTSFTAISGTALIATQILSMYLKNKVKVDKKANAKLCNFLEAKEFIGENGLIISKSIQLKEKIDYEGCCIIAPTGSGKTTSFFYTNLLSNNIKGSIVVIDPKGELYRDTSNFQKNICGRNIVRFSPLEPNLSERYNLLQECTSTTEVCQLAFNLLLNGSLSVELATGKKTSGVEWLQMAEPLLAAALLYVKDLGEPYSTIENAFNLIINLTTKELKKLLGENENRDIKTQFKIFEAAGGSDRTIGSIKVTLTSNLKLFTDKNVNLVTAKTTFKAKELREKPTIVYITFPERKSIYLAPLIAPFFTQFIDKLLDNFNDKSLPIHFMLDEFANIGMVNNFNIHVATVRSRKISLSICLQSISQLEGVYGKDIAQSILNNLKTKIILPSLADINTLKYISDLVGTTEINTINKTVSKNTTTISYSTTTKKLLNLEDIRCLDKESLLIVMQNKNAIKDLQEIYYKSSMYLDKVVKTKDIIKYKNTDTDVEKFEKILKRKIKKMRMKEVEQAKDLGAEIFK